MQSASLPKFLFAFNFISFYSLYKEEENYDTQDCTLLFSFLLSGRALFDVSQVHCPLTWAPFVA